MKIYENKENGKRIELEELMNGDFIVVVDYIIANIFDDLDEAWDYFKLVAGLKPSVQIEEI